MLHRLINSPAQCLCNSPTYCSYIKFLVNSYADINSQIYISHTKHTIYNIKNKYLIKSNRYKYSKVSKILSSAKTLVVSYVGMKTQEVAIKNNLKIVLQNDAEILDEVMVVAFGTQKKSSFTGSAAVVSTEELSKKTTTNVADALVGSVAGLQMRGGSGAPGASQGSIKIRGIASMYANTDPLVIVDGAPYTASLSNIPQEDIESVTVLKDAASAALYGARGAAGVILITTKKGNSSDARVSVDMKWGVNSRAINEYDKITDPGEYYEAAYKQYYNYYFYGQGQNATTANVNANKMMLNQLQYNVYTLPEGQMLIGQDGKLNPNAKLGRSYEANGETYYLQPDNWTDLAYKKALRQEYTMTVSGGSDKSSFYASLGYLNEDGIIDFSGFERITARVKADYQAKKWLRLGANIGYVNSNTKSNPNLSTSSNSTNIMYYTSHIAPIYPAFVRVLDAQGNPQVRVDDNGNPQYDFGVAASNYPGLSRPFLSTGNPLGSNRYNKVTSAGQQLNGTFTLDLTLTDFLKFNATSNINWGHTNFSDYETALYGPKVSVNGELAKYQSDSFRTNNTQTLTFVKDFDKHNVTALIGHEYYKTKTTYLEAVGQGVFSEEILELNAVANTQYASGSYTSSYNVEGYFANAQYSYDDKYFASASYRRDASSRFAKENRWGNFWSVGGAWLLNKENFMSTVSWVDQLKLKVSIGQQGNDNIGNWAYIDLYELSPSSTTQMSPTFSRMGNKDITWETTTNLNIGAEFSFFKGRLTGGIDFYSKKTTDLLFWLSIPESMGTRGYYTNIGDIRNSGIEVVLAGDIIRSRNLTWNVGLNFSHNVSKILKLPESKMVDPEHGYKGFIDGAFWYTPGGSLYNSLRREFAGVNEEGMATYWVDDALEGKTDRPGVNHSRTTTNFQEGSYYEHGDILPKLYGGFQTSLQFYGFDVSATFDYQLGGKIYDSQYVGLLGNWSSAADAGGAFHKDILKSWTPNNTASNMPRFQYGDQYRVAADDRWMTNASYLNFQSFTIGYTLPKKLLRTIGVSRLRVYCSGENLGFWSARKGLDPRYSFASTASMAVYSPVRTISGGIQVSF